MTTQRVQVELKADGSGLRGELRLSRDELFRFTQAAGAARPSLDQMAAGGDRAERSLEGLRGSAAGASGGVRQLAVAVQALATGFALRELTDASVKMASWGAALGHVAGSTQEAARQLDWLNATADALGQRLDVLVPAWIKLAASAKGTALEGQKVAAVFEGVMKASTVLGLSADEVNGTLYALGQMMSKGTVQAEELKGQLGERLPGAFQIAARAMGVTTAELQKMLESGQVMAEDLLPRLARALSTDFAGGVADASKTARAEMARFANELFAIEQQIAGAGFVEGLTNGLIRVREELSDPGARRAAADLGVVLGDAMRLAASGAVLLADNIDLIKIGLTGLIAIKAIGWVRGLSGAITEQTASLHAAATAQLRSTQTTLAAARATAQETNATYLAAAANLEFTQTELARTRAEIAAEQFRKTQQINTIGRLAIQREIMHLRQIEAQQLVTLAARERALAAAATANTAAMAGAAGALRATSVSARAATIAMTGLRSVMAFFGGPLGLTITAAAAGIMVLATRQTEAERAAETHRSALEALNAVLDDTAEGAETAGDRLAALARLRLAEDMRQQQAALREVSQEVFSALEGSLSDVFSPVGREIGHLRRQWQEGSISAAQLAEAVEGIAHAHPEYADMALEVAEAAQKHADLTAAIAETADAQAFLAQVSGLTIDQFRTLRRDVDGLIAAFPELFGAATKGDLGKPFGDAGDETDKLAKSLAGLVAQLDPVAGAFAEYHDRVAILDDALAANLITKERYVELELRAGEALSETLETLDEQADAYDEQLDRLDRQNELLELEIAGRKDLIPVLEAQWAVEDKLGRSLTADELSTLHEKIRLNRELTGTVESREDAEHAATEAWREFAAGVDREGKRLAADVTEAMFEDGGDWKDLGLRIGKRIALGLIEANVTVPIMTQVVGTVPGLFGLQRPDGAAPAGTAGGGGAGNFASPGTLISIADWADSGFAFSQNPLAQTGYRLAGIFTAPTTLATSSLGTVVLGSGAVSAGMTAAGAGIGANVLASAPALTGATTATLGTTTMGTVVATEGLAAAGTGAAAAGVGSTASVAGTGAAGSAGGLGAAGATALGAAALIALPLVIGALSGMFKSKPHPAASFEADIGADGSLGTPALRSKHMGTEEVQQLGNALDTYAQGLADQFGVRLAGRIGAAIDVSRGQTSFIRRGGSGVGVESSTGAGGLRYFDFTADDPESQARALSRVTLDVLSNAEGLTDVTKRVVDNLAAAAKADETLSAETIDGALYLSLHFLDVIDQMKTGVVDLRSTIVDQATESIDQMIDQVEAFQAAVAAGFGSTSAEADLASEALQAAVLQFAGLRDADEPLSALQVALQQAEAQMEQLPRLFAAVGYSAEEAADLAVQAWDRQRERLAQGWTAGLASETAAAVEPAFGRLIEIETNYAARLRDLDALRAAGVVVDETALRTWRDAALASAGFAAAADDSVSPLQAARAALDAMAAAGTLSAESVIRISKALTEQARVGAEAGQRDLRTELLQMTDPALAGLLQLEQDHAARRAQLAEQQAAGAEVDWTLLDRWYQLRRRQLQDEAQLTGEAAEAEAERLDAIRGTVSNLQQAISGLTQLDARAGLTTLSPGALYDELRRRIEERQARVLAGGADGATAAAELPALIEEFRQVSEQVNGLGATWRDDVSWTEQVVSTTREAAQQQLSAAERMLAGQQDQTGLLTEIRDALNDGALNPDTPIAGVDGVAAIIGNAAYAGTAVDPADQTGTAMGSRHSDSMAWLTRGEYIAITRLAGYGGLFGGGQHDEWLAANPESAQIEAALFALAQRYAGADRTIPAFEAGGLFDGGIRLVGERGPELEVTGPARYWSAGDTAGLLRQAMAPSAGGGDLGEVAGLLREVLAELRSGSDAAGQQRAEIGRATLRRLDAAVSALSDGTADGRVVAA